MMIEGNKDTVTIANQCPWCGKHYTFEVPTDGYTAWRVEGKLIQDAFPMVKPTVREFFLTGYCAECQDKLFGDWEDED